MIACVDTFQLPSQDTAQRKNEEFKSTAIYLLALLVFTEHYLFKVLYMIQAQLTPPWIELNSHRAF